ncbi:twitching motility protein PilT [Desulfonispora thiosulfatigenes DSM 11270]|uniref:Twitching motility protein PilT n=1 Tax=Desulfonispora thiosulfatigenes DSM 11270 TaxID=656914 RepID=A0A1W1VPX1_DESTI|nr:type IV pilus twitching motility protein PilT [Desulfonispora thiosulfatigenes]SMB94954.1 twitching motility protein PilT [Desulfonispora thiosulfatigenes DSM 11270]
MLKKNASDLHITVGIPPILRVSGSLHKINDRPLSPQDTDNFVQELLNENQLLTLRENGELDLSFSAAGLGRFRINIYRQRGSYSLAIRTVALNIPSIDDLGFPPILKELAMKQRGLILVTGPTGSGKSTTLASMIDYINTKRSCHILTLEDPIEYLHKHNKSIVNQREIGNDSKSFSNALRSALRQDPDVILVGEMRDLETISIAITAAETGHLVLSTLHTVGAAKTIDRIIDIFPSNQQQQIKVQLSSVLEGIISQQLLEKVGVQERVAALEIMVANSAIRNQIREGKTHQLQTNIQTGRKFGMNTMDNAILELYNQGLVDRKTALTFAVDRDSLNKLMGI